ncbi:hemerythrin domain-containing protein [Sulfurovum sp.]|uniref:hemerythrin domain-containing protein n=1 Tax=Sulfurovum sp. TaxID=1969726 RepID=UPI0025FC5ADD|nr:hemerythrin domain-containing protein [Sulfurovum sp.]
MFGSLFDSKNHKLVRKWEEEHKEIVALALKVIDAYDANDEKTAKQALKDLKSLAVDHVMDEDLKLFNLMKEESGKIDQKTQVMVEDFIAGFKHTKVALINFLAKYASPDVPLNAEFYITFKELADILSQRISFEEANLYSKLNGDQS